MKSSPFIIPKELPSKMNIPVEPNLVSSPEGIGELTSNQTHGGGWALPKEVKTNDEDKALSEKVYTRSKA